MLLPIDYRKRPIKTKYVDEETPMFARWMIFGEYPDGSVCVCSGDDDIFEYMPKEVAEKVIAARDAFVDAMMEAINGNLP